MYDIIRFWYIILMKCLWYNIVESTEPRHRQGEVLPVMFPFSLLIFPGPITAKGYVHSNEHNLLFTLLIHLTLSVHTRYVAYQLCNDYCKLKASFLMFNRGDRCSWNLLLKWNYNLHLEIVVINAQSFTSTSASCVYLVHLVKVADCVNGPPHLLWPIANFDLSPLAVKTCPQLITSTCLLHLGLQTSGAIKPETYFVIG